MILKAINIKILNLQVDFFCKKKFLTIA